MNKLTPRQIDALTEIINIGVGRAASILNEMVGHHVTLHVPEVKIISLSRVGEATGYSANARLSTVKMPFEGALSGIASLIFPPESASKLVAMLVGEESDEADLDSMKVETLNEVGNIVLNSVIGSIGNMLDHRFEYSVPVFSDGVFGDIFNSSSGENSVAIIAKADFSITGHNITGDIMIIFELDSFDNIVAAIDASF